MLEPVHSLVVLFNPWCKGELTLIQVLLSLCIAIRIRANCIPRFEDDQVYVPNEDLLQEYVLRDEGPLFLMERPKPWFFGQVVSFFVRVVQFLDYS